MLQITRSEVNGSPTKCLSFERVRTTDPQQINLRFNEVGVLIVFGGSIEYLTDRYPNGLVRLGPDSGSVFNCHGVREVVNVDQEIDGVFCRIQVECLQKILAEMKLKVELRSSKDDVLNEFSIPQGEAMTFFMNGLKSYCSKDSFFNYSLIFESKLVELLWLSNAYAEGSFIRFMQQYIIPDRSYLESIMNKHYKQNLSLNNLARLAGFSVSTFKRKFVDAYNCSPKRWIQNKRLQEARALLEFSEKTVSEIGYEVGFENTSHFIHSFKLKFGTTPKSLQEKYAKEKFVRLAS